MHLPEVKSVCRKIDFDLLLDHFFQLVNGYGRGGKDTKGGCVPCDEAPGSVSAILGS